MTKEGYFSKIKITLVVLFAILMLIAAVLLMQENVSASSDLNKPDDFKAVKYGLYNKAKLSWSGSYDATGYQIYRASKSCGKYHLIKTTKKGSRVFINRKLNKKGVYYYKMRAVSRKNGRKIYSSFTETKKVIVKHMIAGESNVDAQQLVRYYKKSGVSFPSYYKKTDARTLRQFCQMYIEESRAEGIRPEVAFTQSMLETGWLKFGGSVKRKQNNFAGLGAVGGGVKGNSFKTVRKGIRAQVQHLKAYATKKRPNHKLVDKRFNYVNRGCAPYVEWLGIGDNPTHDGWCAGSGYGYTLVRMMEQI